MSPKAFRADPDARVLTSWAVIGGIITLAFGAGAWATWMSFSMTSLKDQVAEIRSDLKELKTATPDKAHAVSRNP